VEVTKRDREEALKCWNDSKSESAVDVFAKKLAGYRVLKDSVNNVLWWKGRNCKRNCNCCICKLRKVAKEIDGPEEKPATASDKTFQERLAERVRNLEGKFLDFLIQNQELRDRTTGNENLMEGNRPEYIEERVKKEIECLAKVDRSMSGYRKRLIRDLEHHRDTTVGLWATDRPDLISDPVKVMFQITGPNGEIGAFI
jgi:hypothetical protein